MIKASLIYDGRGYPNIPEEMGKPKEGQMEGTPAEQLTELAGRICYDSLDKGRSSREYHEHVLKVGHLSVCEHFHFTVSMQIDISPSMMGRVMYVPLLYLYQSVANRPGIYITQHGNNGVRITTNLRTVLDWDQYTKEFIWADSPLRNVATALGDALANVANSLAPTLVKPKRQITSAKADLNFGIKMDMNPADPIDDHEKWVSLFCSGSRGMSHELVRHGDWTGISQRSTRFVDETETPWITHPLLSMYMQDTKDDALGKRIEDLVKQSRSVYCDTTNALEKWISERGVEKVAARKQARGAARGYLGNGLLTELIFSASVAQWKHMLRLRCSAPAEAEIRQVFCEALQALKRTGYYDSFKDLDVVTSPDGVGKCLKEQG